MWGEGNGRGIKPGCWKIDVREMILILLNSVSKNLWCEIMYALKYTVHLRPGSKHPPPRIQLSQTCGTVASPWKRRLKQDKTHLPISQISYLSQLTNLNTNYRLFDSGGWILSCFILHVLGSDGATCLAWLREGGYLLYLTEAVHRYGNWSFLLLHDNAQYHSNNHVNVKKICFKIYARQIIQDITPWIFLAITEQDHITMKEMEYPTRVLS